MTSDQFLQALAQLGWKQSDFCRKTGLTAQTPSRWVNGHGSIPAWVDHFLGAMLDLAALHRKYLAPLPARQEDEGAADVPGDGVEAGAAGEASPEPPGPATPPPARLAHLLPRPDGGA
jgi:transcriptional regulator with XRE-family HTH domain